VEQKACANAWDKIDYSHVPSLAFSRYNKSFLRHDEYRFKQFIESAMDGTEKVNASAVYPHDVVKLLNDDYLSETTRNAINVQWHSLPNYLNNDNNLIVVADVSGSMHDRISGGNVIALDVCISLAMYISERTHGLFKDKFITFSSSATTLVSKPSHGNACASVITKQFGSSESGLPSKRPITSRGLPLALIPFSTPD
jgi:hypothetical protein